MKRRLLACCAAASLSVGLASPGATAQAQTASLAAAGADLDELVVTGNLQIGAEQRTLKKENIQIVDGIGRVGIEAAPALSMVDIIRRLPGVAVNAQGAGAYASAPGAVSIRGLPYLATTLDGREVVTPNARNLNMGAIPPEFLDGIEVYKTPSANQVEGGMAGLINMRLRDPLDFDRFEASARVSGVYDDGMHKTLPSVNFMLGDARETSLGRMGVVLMASHKEAGSYSIGPASGGWVGNTGLFDVNGNGKVGDAADQVIVPPTTGATQGNPGLLTSFINKNIIKNDTILGKFQWNPSSSTELYASYARIDWNVDAFQYGAGFNIPSTNDSAFIHSFTLIPGTNVVASGTIGPTRFVSQSVATPTRNSTQQFALGGAWESGPLQVTFDLSRDFTIAKSRYHLVYAGRPIDSAQFWVTHDNMGGSVPGVDLTDPTPYRLLAFVENRSRNKHYQTAGRFDVEYRLGESGLHTLQAGVRLVDSDTGLNPSVSRSFAVSASNGPNFSQLYTPMSDKLSGSYVMPDANLSFDDIERVRSLVGSPLEAPASNPVGTYRFEEKTSAIYLRGLFDGTLGVPFEGDVGVRLVRTSTQGDGFQINSRTGALTPTSDTGRYTNALPSFNLTLNLTSQLNLRFSGSGTVTRPDYASLSPATNADFANGTATVGNPNLKPFTSRGADTALEWYHSRSGYVFAAAFYKDLDGFIVRTVTRETIQGVPLDVSRTRNGGAGSMKGVEFGLNERLDFLPGPLAGLGVNANATFTHGEVTISPGVKGRLTGVPKSAYNIGATYQYGRLGATINYNWNSSYPFVADKSVVVEAVEILDASLRFRLNDNFELFANAINLANTAGFIRIRPTVNGDLPANPYSNSRQFELGVRATF